MFLFDTRIVVAAIKRGGQVWEYKVEGVTADHATLTVRCGATSKDGSGAQFASPMVVSVARGPYKNVIFIENGKEVGKVSFHEGNDRPKQVWTRVGSLGETPRHVTDAYPLSDQQNKRDWSKFEPMSDEFLIFDSETMPGWFGMPDDADLPSTFSVEYVRAWKRR
jgi:hypothetical protein